MASASLGQLRYLSAILHVDGVVGNSSSGLAEVPSMRKGTVNIGDRQRGRLKASSVIDCEPVAVDILNAIEKLYSTAFQHTLADSENPYGDGGASEKIVKLLMDVDLTNVVKKHFYDIPYSEYR
jgi:GDP/UDP-N,N'-diacetylbacillosamine 2-epimerase (hydrolysing)